MNKINTRRNNKIKLILSLYNYDNNIINYIIICWTLIIFMLILITYLL